MKKLMFGLVVLLGFVFVGANQQVFAHGGPGGGHYHGGGYGGGYGGGFGGGGHCHRGPVYGGGFYRPMPRPVYAPYYGGGYPGYYGGSGFGFSIVKPGFGFSVNNYGW